MILRLVEEHRVLSVESPKNLVPKFFNDTAKTYDKVVSRSTFGKDKYWKREIIRLITDGDSFLDLACGTGILTREIAKKIPNGRIVGIDITEGYLDVAKRNSKSFQNITFLQQDAEKLNLKERFDCITSSYLAKYCDPNILVKACIDHLNPGGKIIFHDFTYPKNHPARIIWDMNFVMLNLVGYFMPSWKKAFSDLPKLIRSSEWSQNYEIVMKNHGLKVGRQSFTWNSSVILVGVKSE